MRRVKPFILFWLLIESLNSLAHDLRPGQIHALAGPYLYQTNFSPVNGFGESPFMAGAGLIAQGDVDQNGGIEISIFYTQDLYKRDLAGQALIEKAKRMRISTGYRHWFTTQVGLAALLYSAYSIGDPQVIHNDFAPLRVTNTSAQDVTEYGLDISLQWEFWQAHNLSSFIDGRYSLSFTSKDHEDADQYGILVGFKVQVQESSEKPTN